MARAVHTVHFPRFTDVTCVATLFATPHVRLRNFISNSNGHQSPNWAPVAARAHVHEQSFARRLREAVVSHELYDLNSERESVSLRKRNTTLHDRLDCSSANKDCFTGDNTSVVWYLTDLDCRILYCHILYLAIGEFSWQKKKGCSDEQNLFKRISRVEWTDSVFM